MKEPKKFCERSLKLWLGMFAALVCVVLLWAILFEDDSRPNNRKLVDWSVIGRKRFRAIDGVTHATPKGGVKFIAKRPAAASRKSSESIYELVLPATVAISAISLPAGGGRAPGQAQRLPQQVGQRFVEPFDGIPDKQIGNQVYENVGSGVIIDERGYIVTNHHVVENASHIVVTLFGRLKGHYPARIVASDRKTELALLKLPPRTPSYPYLRLGDSNLVEPGAVVFAMGSPFGFSQSMAKGIISSKKRSMVIQGIDLGKMLQVDAHINKGSSGGPLVNRSGEVIGINTAIYAPGGIPSGIGFAIPSNRARKFLSRFPKVFGEHPVPARLRKDIVDRSHFGVEVLPVDRVIARIFDLPKACGVVVNRVLMGSPAQKSGIRRGDVITRIGAEVVRDTDSLFKIGKETAWEKGTKITVYRNGKALLLDIK